MKYSFSTSLVEDNGETAWVAESKELNSCIGVGATQEEALKQLEESEQLWLDFAMEMGLPIPEVVAVQDKSFSGKLTVRLSPKEHKAAANQASCLGVSLNQYINDAIVAYTQNQSNLSMFKSELNRLEMLINSKPQINIFTSTDKDKYYPAITSKYSTPAIEFPKYISVEA